MKIRVIDFETTGNEKDIAAGKQVAICEVGYTDICDGEEVLPPVAHLVNPGMPIPPDARAVHHISDAMVKDAISPSEACQLLMEGMEPGDIFAAHNYEFEQAFFTGGVFKWICSLKCARHIFNESPSHTNQTLRYYLGIDEELSWPEMAMPPHRAGPDTYVTAHIILRLLKNKSAEQLIELTQQSFILEKVSFGKYKGQLWSDMDEGFLRFILDRDFDKDTMATARHWYDQRTKDRATFII